MNASPTLRRPLSLVAVLLAARLRGLRARAGTVRDPERSGPDDGCGRRLHHPRRSRPSTRVTGRWTSASSAATPIRLLLLPADRKQSPESSSNGALDPNEIQLSGFQVDITPHRRAPPPADPDRCSTRRGRWRTSRSPGRAASRRAAVSSPPSSTAFPVALAQQLVDDGRHRRRAVADRQPARSRRSGPPTAGPRCSRTRSTSRSRSAAAAWSRTSRPAPSRAAPANPGNACNPAQDVPVDCCTENGALRLSADGGGVSDRPARPAALALLVPLACTTKDEQLPLPAAHRQRRARAAPAVTRPPARSTVTITSPADAAAMSDSTATSTVSATVDDDNGTDLIDTSSVKVVLTAQREHDRRLHRPARLHRR